MARVRPRLIFAWLFSICLTLFLMEVAVRGYFATKVGPRLLLYGTRWRSNTEEAMHNTPSAGVHMNEFGGYSAYDAASTGYSKYFPNEVKYTESPDRKGTYRVRINNQGFRGADFATEKAPGTFRILTLGASSTFGYHDRDDETYPYYLEKFLNERSHGRHFEVINFGIPHATSQNILALFLAEGVPLHPDLVTFYEGANDAGVVDVGVPTLPRRVWDGLRQVSLTAEFLNYTLRIGVTNEAYMWGEELAERRAKAFLANLDLLHEECRKRGIRMLVSTQQMKSQRVRPKGVTYDEEVQMVRDMVARGEIGPSHPLPWSLLNPWQGILAVLNAPRMMLIHAHIMNALRGWAPQHPDVEFVDGIHVLDQDRNLLANWVHLRAEGNAKLADALANEILSRARGVPPLAARRAKPGGLHSPLADARPCAARAENRISGS